MVKEYLSSVLMVCMVIGLFSVVECDLYSSVSSSSFEPIPPVITCTVTGDDLSFFHKGGYPVSNWSLYVNDTLVFEGSNFKIGDTITYHRNNCSNGLPINFYGDNVLLFWSKT